MAIKSTSLVVSLPSQQDVRHIAEINLSAIRAGFQHHTAKFLSTDKPAHRGHRELVYLARRHGRLPDLPRCYLRVLLLDRGHHVGGGEIAVRHSVRIEPDPHAVIALTEIRNF